MRVTDGPAASSRPFLHLSCPSRTSHGFLRAAPPQPPSRALAPAASGQVRQAGGRLRAGPCCLGFPLMAAVSAL